VFLLESFADKLAKDKVKRLYGENSIYYEQEILGLIHNSAGKIFTEEAMTAFDKENRYVSPERYPHIIYIGLDPNGGACLSTGEMLQLLCSGLY
jgi:hypothetical protein